MRDGGKLRLYANNLFLTYLDRDHRERENIGFFAICPLPVQNLRCSPSCGVTLVIRSGSYRVQVLGDRSKTKIGDPCTVIATHKDIWLDMCQYGSKIGFRTITYSLEIAVNYVAGVEKVKPFGDITYLVVGISVRSSMIERAPTRPSRSAPGRSLIYSVRSPPGIHSEMSWRGEDVMPRKGTMFLCFERFHITASW
jgi:hypothetical protein